jgi:hypothetical protein
MVDYFNDESCDWDQEDPCEDSWSELLEMRFDYEPDRITYHDAYAYWVRDWDMNSGDQEEYMSRIDLYN